jgi:hypothetical protein
MLSHDLVKLGAIPHMREQFSVLDLGQFKKNLSHRCRRVYTSPL